MFNIAGNAGQQDFFSYLVDDSIVTNGSNEYLSRTNGSAATDAKKATLSFFYKAPHEIGSHSANETVFSAGTDTTTYCYLFYQTSAKEWWLTNRYSSGDTSQQKWAVQHRDYSAFWHIVLVFDSANATEADRGRLYINNVEMTNSYVLGVPLNDGFAGTDNGNPIQVGRYAYLANAYLRGCLSHLHLVDGQVLSPSDFAESKNGVWVPKEYTGGHGNNGFFLDFSNAASLGDDASGNGNHFTENNIDSTNHTTDTPTDNCCNYSENHVGSGVVTGNGRTSSGVGVGTFNALAMSSYWEITANAASVVGGVREGMGDDTTSTTSIANGKTYGFRINTAGDLDYINITDAGSWTSLTTGLTGVQHPYGAGGSNTINCGQAAFAGTVPSGYKALRAGNIPKGSVTTSGSFTGNASTDGPEVFLNGTPDTMTINGNSVTWGTHARKLANGFKVLSSSTDYNASGSNTFSVSVAGPVLKYAHAEGTV